MAAGLIVLLIAIFRLPRHRMLIGFCFILFAAGNSLMESAMITRHPPVLWEECVISGYYQLPAIVLFFIAFIFVMKPLGSSLRIGGSVTAAILVIIICANIIALPGHNKVRTEFKNARNQAGYIIAAPIIHNKLVLLSRTKPAGPPLPYDAVDASNSIVYFLNSDNMVISTGNIRAADYIITSRIYNFLRSRKGLPYYINWKGLPPYYLYSK